MVRSGDDDVAEVFAICCEDLVRGLPAFRGDASIRTWAYVVARHAASRFARGNRRRERRIALPGAIVEPVAAPHSRTAPYRRTAVKDRLSAARAQLAPDEALLVVLRVDQQLGWRAIAAITADAPLDAPALAAANRRCASASRS